MNHKMSPELFKVYENDPLHSDALIRTKFNVPDNRYYTVSVWPTSGFIRIDNNRFRDATKSKISKSDQQ